MRVAGDRWRRIATGAGRPRPGGYRLTEGDLASSVRISRASSPSTRAGSAACAARCCASRPASTAAAPIDALNDHLLALRFLLEGEGPAGVGLPMRVAALTQDGEDASTPRHVVEQAIALERELWSGEPAAERLRPGPAEIAAQVEELLRTILRRGVAGELGSDFRAAADETLLADGLAFGEGAGRARHGHRVGHRDGRARSRRPSRPAGASEPTVEEAQSAASARWTPEDFEDRRRRGDPRQPRGEPPARIEGSPDRARPEPARRARTSRRCRSASASVEEDELRGAAASAARRPTRRTGSSEVDGDATMDFPARSEHLDELVATADGSRGGQGAGRSTSSRAPRPNWTVGTQARPRRAAS